MYTALLLLILPAQAQDPEMMVLHLVRAFDVSASVNDVEFDRHRHGTANANALHAIEASHGFS